MLKIGDKVELEGIEYEIVLNDSYPCKQCSIHHCSKNEALDELKAMHFALSCVDLIPENACFKQIEVEQAPQVVYK